MSHRDAIVNALLGILLLLVFLASFAAFALAVWLGFIGLEWIAHRVAPNFQPSETFVPFGMWALALSVGVIRHARSKHWRSAFFCFICVPLVALACFGSTHSPIGGAGWSPLWFVSLLAITAIGEDTTLGRIGFFLASGLACAAVLVISGLLGTEALAHTVANCAIVISVAWMIVSVRISQKKSYPPVTVPSIGV